MNAVEFEGQNVVFAKDQPQYLPLPAHVTEDKNTVISCWELSDLELEVVLKTKRIYFASMTFNEPLQPQRAAVTLEELK